MTFSSCGINSASPGKQTSSGRTQFVRAISDSSQVYQNIYKVTARTQGKSASWYRRENAPEKSQLTFLRAQCSVNESAEGGDHNERGVLFFGHRSHLSRELSIQGSSPRVTIAFVSRSRLRSICLRMWRYRNCSCLNLIKLRRRTMS